MPSNRILVNVLDLAEAVHVPVSCIRALVDMGYLCKVPYRNNFGNLNRYRIAKINKAPDRLPIRIIDRISIAMWMLGLDKDYYPSFSLYIEKEIMRIRGLPDPQRTEQAIRILRRYVDAETLVEAVARARAGDVAAVEIARLSRNYKQRIRRLAGLTDMGREESVRATAQTPAQTPTPARSQSRSRPPSSARVRPVEPAE